MNVPDFINASFEFWGSILLLLNIRQVYIDKEVNGIHWIPTTFFTIWGFWNFYFYYNLHQWISLFGAVTMAIVNTWWLYLMWYYRKNS